MTIKEIFNKRLEEAKKRKNSEKQVETLNKIKDEFAFQELKTLNVLINLLGCVMRGCDMEDPYIFENVMIADILVEKLMREERSK